MNPFVAAAGGALAGAAATAAFNHHREEQQAAAEEHHSPFGAQGEPPVSESQPETPVTPHAATPHVQAYHEAPAQAEYEPFAATAPEPQVAAPIEPAQAPAEYVAAPVEHAPFAHATTEPASPPHVAGQQNHGHETRDAKEHQPA